MPTEAEGFEPEPTFNLAALAGQEQLQERLYAAQNLLVKREAEIARLTDERAGKVLVGPEDLRQVLTLAARDPASWSPAERGAYNAVFDAAEAAAVAVSDGSATASEGVSVDLRDAP